jgi:hypothetical protein
MNKQRIFVIILALVGAASLYLPWVTSAKGSVDGTLFPKTGWIIPALFIITIIISFLGDRKSDIKGLLFYLVTILPLTTAGIAISNILTINSQMTSHHGNANIFEIGIGLYTIIVIGLLIPVILYVFKQKKRVEVTYNINDESIGTKD